MQLQTSQKKTDANRRNAKKSTGPRSPEGKKKVSRNSTKHGLLAKEVVIKSGDLKEDEYEFQLVISALRKDFSAHGAMEKMLVEKIAVCYWRLRRVLRCENGELRNEAKRLELLRSAESQRLVPDSVPPQNSFTTDSLSLPHQEASDKILRYEIAIERQMYRAISELERLQRRRLGDAVPPPTLKVQI